jgi:hypothetical protein
MSAQIQTRGFVFAGIQFANCGTDVLESYKRPCFFLPWRGNDSHHKKFLGGGTSKLTFFPSNSDAFLSLQTFTLILSFAIVTHEFVEKSNRAFCELKETNHEEVVRWDLNGTMRLTV